MNFRRAQTHVRERRSAFAILEPSQYGVGKGSIHTWPEAGSPHFFADARDAIDGVIIGMAFSELRMQDLQQIARFPGFEHGQRFFLTGSPPELTARIFRGNR